MQNVTSKWEVKSDGIGKLIPKWNRTNSSIPARVEALDTILDALALQQEAVASRRALALTVTFLNKQVQTSGPLRVGCSSLAVHVFSP